MTPESDCIRLKLEGDLSSLVDARGSVARIRAELLRQAEGLRQSADLIAFSEHADQLALAADAFKATLVEVVKFSEKISALIQNVGRGAMVPLT